MLEFLKTFRLVSMFWMEKFWQFWFCFSFVVIGVCVCVCVCVCACTYVWICLLVFLWFYFSFSVFYPFSSNSKVLWLPDFTFTFQFHALEKEMATHSSVLTWRIPGTEVPSGLLSMGSHRVGHDWSDLAAAAAQTSTCNARDLGLIPGLGRSPGGRHGNPLQYPSLENP